MIEKILNTNETRLLEIWESSVKATHGFLTESDFEFYKTKLPYYLQQVNIYIYKDDNTEIKGFLGVSEDKIEMLFIENESRGTGIGKKLLKFATNCLKLTKVDVNKQNEQALSFYKHFGFRESGRSLLDSEGKNYPIIHLQQE